MRILNNFPACEHHDCPHAKECGQYQNSDDGLAPRLYAKILFKDHTSIKAETQIECNEKFYEFRTGRQALVNQNFLPRSVSDVAQEEIDQFNELPAEEALAALDKKLSHLNDRQNIDSLNRCIFNDARIAKSFEVAIQKRLFAGKWKHWDGNNLKGSDKDFVPLIKLFKSGYHEAYTSDTVTFRVNDSSLELSFSDNATMQKFAIENGLDISYDTLDRSIQYAESEIKKATLELERLNSLKASLQAKKTG